MDPSKRPSSSQQRSISSYFSPKRLSSAKPAAIHRDEPASSSPFSAKSPNGVHSGIRSPTSYKRPLHSIQSPTLRTLKSPLSSQTAAASGNTGLQSNIGRHIGARRTLSFPDTPAMPFESNTQTALLLNSQRSANASSAFQIQQQQQQQQQQHRQDGQQSNEMHHHLTGSRKRTRDQFEQYHHHHQQQQQQPSVVKLEHQDHQSESTTRIAHGTAAPPSRPIWSSPQHQPRSHASHIRSIPSCTSSNFSNASSLPLSSSSAIVPPPPSPSPQIRQQDTTARTGNNQGRATMFQSYAADVPDWLRNPRDRDMRPEGHPDYDPTTLFIPASERAKMTDFERQYWDIKCEQFDTVVFFKKGKFYELYGPDAHIGKYEFDLQITDQRGIPMVGFPESQLHQRACLFVGRGYKVGIVEQLEKAVTKTGRGITKRKLTRVLTPGTLTMDYINDIDTRDTFDKLYLMAIVEDEFDGQYGLCFADCSTGAISLGYFDDDDNRTAFTTVMNQIVPRELLICPLNLSPASQNIVENMHPRPIVRRVRQENYFLGRDTLLQELKARQYFHTTDNLPDDELMAYLPMGLAQMFQDPSERASIALQAFSAVLRYLQSAFIDDAIISLRHVEVFDPKNPRGNMLSDHLVLDGQALTNLEIMHNMTDGSRRGTLIQWLDKTVTPFGRRTFREWVCHPLKNAEKIRQRQDAIEYLLCNRDLMESIRDCVKHLPDLERLLAKLHTEARTVEDAVMYDADVDNKKLHLFKSVLDAFKTIQDVLMTEIITDNVRNDLSSSILVQLTDCTAIPDMESLVHLEEQNRHQRIVRYYDISSMVNYFESLYHSLIDRSPTASASNPQLESLLSQRQAIENELDKHLEELKGHLGATDLKYVARYVDIPSRRFVVETSRMASHSKISAFNKQMTASFTFVDVKKMAKKVAFRTSFIKQMVDDLEQVNERLADIYRSMFKDVLREFDQYYFVWKSVVDCVGELDCLISLAMSCTGARLCRPEIVFDNDRPILHVRGMRNALLETRSYRNEPNDVTIGGTIDGVHQPQMVLLTGANMSGKSTLMRSVCLTVILAQLGCFVPADSCRLTPVDRIFTRIGANDRIMSNESTFMVEMLETSAIMAHATKHSLVILDELGRGTATHDGYAIAYSVANYITRRRQCRCLFATHYHQLCRELENNKNVALYKMDHIHDDEDGSIVFTYRCVPGACETSFGVDCARQAGIPDHVVQQARKTSELFECTMRRHMLQVEKLAKRVSPQKEKAFAELVALLRRTREASTAEEREQAMQALVQHQSAVILLD